MEAGAQGSVYRVTLRLPAPGKVSPFGSLFRPEYTFRVAPAYRRSPIASSNRAYPDRLTGSLAPSCRIARRLSFPYGSIRATRSRLTIAERWMRTKRRRVKAASRLPIGCCFR